SERPASTATTRAQGPPPSLASSSRVVDGDGRGRHEPGAVVTLDLAEDPVDAAVTVRIDQRVVRVERAPLRIVLAIRLPLLEDFRVDFVIEKRLARDGLSRPDQHLEVDVRRTAAVPAGIYGRESDEALRVGDLRAAQERRPDRGRYRDAADALLALVAGVKAERVGLPQVEAHAFERRAIPRAPNLHRKLERRAGPAFRHIGA